ncbi:DeoR family transcriptional regulator [Streptomyces radicis]|uniref:DeoR family transcriptional regulator n=2 Tax=Streptomyces radicis TaxID=1750517 RepID=A0A3A9VYH1_9ACTN|nr:DeoR family transcriptional regulator [Streptomyces radicis]RKN17720.1 DeoR family transcriptional regulator [Streptomyces radicis]
MLVAQRHELLLRELRATGVVRIADLAARFGVSGETIRRDLTELAAAGHVTKVRGGAILATPTAPTGTPTDPGAATAARPPATAHTLGLLVPSATYYYPQVVEGVRAVAARRDARVVIGLTDYAQPRDLQQIDELRASGATGLLVASTGGHYLPSETLARLRAGDVPFVLLERQPANPYEACEYVASDHRQGAYGAAAHLKGLGHARVALYTNGSPTAPLIREGYGAAVDQLGLDPSAPIVDGGRPTLGHQEAARQYEAFIDACLASGTRAALIHSDHDAIQLMQRLRARGLRTPDDLALIAYDNEIAALAEVPLTAVAPPKYEIGEQAALLMLDRLDATESMATRQIYLQPRLIVRQSCGASAAAGA